MSSSHFVSGQDVRARAKRFAKEVVLTELQRFVIGPAKLWVNRRKSERFLEIGPGPLRIPGFETVNITGGRQVDYVANATKRLPFAANSFDVIYASHILEHVPWYQLSATLNEWVRVLKPGGAFEVWVPDGLKIAEAFVLAERQGSAGYTEDGWWRSNAGQDPCIWMAGRTFSYGDGSGAPGHFNWHRATFSERYLKELLANVGLTDIRTMELGEVRGYNHGWINLGVRGRKPGVSSSTIRQLPLPDASSSAQGISTALSL